MHFSAVEQSPHNTCAINLLNRPGLHTVNSWLIQTCYYRFNQSIWVKLKACFDYSNSENGDNNYNANDGKCSGAFAVKVEQIG